MEKTYNVDNIVSVIVRKKRLSCEFDYVHIPEKRIFGIFKQKERIYIETFLKLKYSINKYSINKFIKEYGDEYRY